MKRYLMTLTLLFIVGLFADNADAQVFRQRNNNRAAEVGTNRQSTLGMQRIRSTKSPVPWFRIHRPIG